VTLPARRKSVVAVDPRVHRGLRDFGSAVSRATFAGGEVTSVTPIAGAGVLATRLFRSVAEQSWVR
jgi:hypothetical protein